MPKSHLLNLNCDVDQKQIMTRTKKVFAGDYEGAISTVSPSVKVTSIKFTVEMEEDGRLLVMDIVLHLVA